MITAIRCSKLDRPMKCAGSEFFTDLREEEPGAPAKEGTAAGEYLERMLQNGNTNDIPEKYAKNGVLFDRDMRFYTVPIALDIFSKAQTKIKCEHEIDWQTRSGIWIKGHPDATYVHNGNLYIDDLKYGWGLVEVGPKKPNWQLLGYAIGEVIQRATPFPWIVMRIHQPRPHHEDGSTREWRITYEQLLGYKEMIEERMMQISQGFKQLNTGEQCKYCPAAADKCPALNRAFYNAVDVIMDDHVQDNLDEAGVANQLDLIDRVKHIMKVKEDSLRDLAISKIKAGKIIPNYTTEVSYGDRKWKNYVSPDVVKTLTGKSIIKEEMLSPSQAEKMGVPKNFVDKLVDRHFIGMKLKRADTGAIGDKIFGNGDPNAR